MAWGAFLPADLSTDDRPHIRQNLAMSLHCIARLSKEGGTKAAAHPMGWAAASPAISIFF